MAPGLSSGRIRIGAALAAAGIEFGLAALLVAGLAVSLSAPRGGGTTLVTFTPAERPPPPPPPQPPRPERDPGRSAPRASRAEALPREAPSPPIVLAAPSPAASSAAAGVESDGGDPQGAGEGTGRGGSGAGPGEGVGAPVRIAGALSDSDYPRASAASGTVAIAFRVRSDGRVDLCRVVASSGAPLLDRLTCRLVERRFRYRPALDADGRPVDTMLRTSFTWGMRARGR